MDDRLYISHENRNLTQKYYICFTGSSNDNTYVCPVWSHISSNEYSLLGQNQMEKFVFVINFVENVTNWDSAEQQKLNTSSLVLNP